MTQDESNLNLLSVFHYVVGGFTALFACFPVFHLLIGIGLLTGKFAENEEVPLFFGWIFVLIPAFMILLGWILAGCMVFSGIQLGKRKSYTFCLVVACVECILFPFGTVLGVLTLIMLTRDPVKKLFQPEDLSNSLS